MKLAFNKRSSAVGMSPDSERLGAAVEVGVGSNLTAQRYFIFLNIHFLLTYLHQ